MSVAGGTVSDLSAAMVVGPVAAAQWLIILPLALCLAVGALLVMLHRRVRAQGGVAVAALGVLVLLDSALLSEVVAHGPVTMVMRRWLPPFGITFTVDLLGALMALAAALVALAAGVYALSDLSGGEMRPAFFPLLMLLTSGVTGAFLTGDIFNLYVWFEVLLIASFGLLILGSERAQIDGALKYAVLNLIATTLFLVAIGYLYALFGTLNMADIALKARAGGGTLPLMTLSCLFLLAFAMKAAAFPVNFWLPASYHTPRPVVSALFAGLLTKVGIYGILRVLVMLLPDARGELGLLISIVAVATMLAGVLGALSENDLRRLLGYVVISGIGNMLAGIALGSPAGLNGTIFYALHSIVLMTALYMVAGQAAVLGGGFLLTNLSGLWRRSPGFAGLSLVLFFAASGLPPFSGFWPKVVLVQAALERGAWWLAGAILLTGLLTTIVFGRVFLFAYWRPGVAAMAATDSVAIGWRAGLPLALLTALVVGFGVFPEPLLRLTQAAAASLLDPAAYVGSVFPGGAP